MNAVSHAPKDCRNKELAEYRANFKLHSCSKRLFNELSTRKPRYRQSPY